MSEPAKIAIVATAPTSRLLAPWRDESWLKWVCSEGNKDVPCADAWFELHALQDVADPKDAWWVEWLRAQPFDIYMQDANPLVPRAKRFPIEGVLKEFPSDFLTSTPALMMAWAIQQPGIAEIGLYGVDMAHETEYAHQRPAMRYLILEARKRGIRVTVPQESDIDKPGPVYGYCWAAPHARKFRARKLELKAQQEKWDKAEADACELLAQIRRDKAAVAGALENQAWIERTYS